MLSAASPARGSPERAESRCARVTVQLGGDMSPETPRESAVGYAGRMSGKRLRRGGAEVAPQTRRTESRVRRRLHPQPDAAAEGEDHVQADTLSGEGEAAKPRPLR